MTDQPKRIVLIGGGYTTLYAFFAIKRKLRRELRNGHVEVTLIAPKTYHSYHGWTAEAVTGVVSSQNRRSPLRRLLKGHRFILGEVTSIDADAQSLAYRTEGTGSQEMPFDHLIIGNGSYDNVEAVPGLAEFGYSPKSHDGVEILRDALIHALETASTMEPGPERETRLRVVIAGGGFAGVELAANIAEMFVSLRRYFPVLRDRQPDVVLLHSGDEILPDLRPKYQRLVDYAKRHLDRYGIDTRLNTRLTKVEEGHVILSDGSSIETNILVTTVGQTVRPLPGCDVFSLSEKGLIETDKFLHVSGRHNIWAGGDAASVPYVGGGICPSNALWAFKHGQWIGTNVARTIKGNTRLKPFNFKGLGQSASLGVGKGASELFGVQLTGWIGWFARFFFFLYYQPSSAYAVRLFFDWIFFAFFGRYITVRPLKTPTEP